jgi:hypothetical protein
MSAPPSGLALILTFLVLEVLAVISWLASAAGAPTAVVLAIATVMMAINAAMFMELKSAHPALRVIATAVVFFIALLCAGIAGDAALRGAFGQ